jgi:SAM-dependent methyltransferase
MDEASKSKRHYPDLFSKFISGNILDIGAGIDPVHSSATIFDKPQGNAERIFDHYKKESFDTVFSSHCLEHISDPSSTIKEWFELVRPGGIFFIIVPDEDLYEQGHFPSIFNNDHKATFTVSKEKSWSPVSINCLDLANTLDGDIVYLKQQSDNYNFKRLTFAKLGIQKFRIVNLILRFKKTKTFFQKVNLMPIDQTSLDSTVLAQICLIIRKRN